MQEPEGVAWHTANGMNHRGSQNTGLGFFLVSFIQKEVHFIQCNDSATASFRDETLLSSNQCCVYFPSDGKVSCS